MSLLQEVGKKEFLVPILNTVHQQVVKRIFDDGKDAQGAQIGTYSEPYIKRRQRKGLGANSKVNLEFTGQMRNDFLIVEEGDKVGSGFLNRFNYDKSKWVEATYGKEIFNLTKDEEELLSRLINQGIQNLIANGQT
jgi:hypothetical protein